MQPRSTPEDDELSDVKRRVKVYVNAMKEDMKQSVSLIDVNYQDDEYGDTIIMEVSETRVNIIVMMIL